MTIDEALTDCEYGLAFTDQEYDQLAEWLEELKQRRQTNFDYVSLMDKRYYDGYNKAVDEFVETLTERLRGMQMVELQGEDVCPCNETGEDCPYINQDIGCQYCAREQTIKDINEIAEHLKKGGAE